MNTDKVNIAIDRLKMFEPEDGYHLSYSGGKDSDCIKILAYLAGVNFEPEEKQLCTTHGH